MPSLYEKLLQQPHKRAMTAIFVPSHAFSLLSSPHVRLGQVSSAFDQADKTIEQRVSAGDLVITSDILLAADVIAKSALVLTSRGVRHTKNNI